MALNIAVPLSGLGGLSPYSPIGTDCWEHIKILVSPLGSESSGVSSLDSEEAKQTLQLSPPKTPEDLKILYNGRDILDLGGNIQTNSKRWNLRYTYLPENNNIPMFLANRSQYHRLGANGHIQDYSLIKCENCDFQYPINSGGPFCQTSVTISPTTNAAMTYTGQMNHRQYNNNIFHSNYYSNNQTNGNNIHSCNNSFLKKTTIPTTTTTSSSINQSGIMSPSMTTTPIKTFPSSGMQSSGLTAATLSAVLSTSPTSSSSSGYSSSSSISNGGGGGGFNFKYQQQQSPISNNKTVPNNINNIYSLFNNATTNPNTNNNQVQANNNGLYNGQQNYQRMYNYFY